MKQAPIPADNRTVTASLHVASATVTVAAAAAVPPPRQRHFRCCCRQDLEDSISSRSFFRFSPSPCCAVDLTLPSSFAILLLLWPAASCPPPPPPPGKGRRGDRRRRLNHTTAGQLILLLLLFPNRLSVVWSEVSQHDFLARLLREVRRSNVD